MWWTMPPTSVGASDEGERPAVREEVVDESREAVDLLAQGLDARGVLGGGGLVGRAVAAAQDVEAEGQRVQRVLDLVREAGREMADLGALFGAREPHLQLLPLAQPLRHVIEGGGEAADLVVAVHRHRHVEPPLGDLRGAVGERVERARRVAREDEHHGEAEREHAEEREEPAPEVVGELRADVLEVVGDLDVSAQLAVDDDRHDEAAGSWAPSR